MGPTCPRYSPKFSETLTSPFSHLHVAPHLGLVHLDLPLRRPHPIVLALVWGVLDVPLQIRIPRDIPLDCGEGAGGPMTEGWQQGPQPVG